MAGHLRKATFVKSNRRYWDTTKLRPIQPWLFQDVNDVFPADIMGIQPVYPQNLTRNWLLDSRLNPHGLHMDRP